VDVLGIAEKASPGLKDHKVKSVSEHFGVDTTSHHRAIRDCNMTNECFRHCKEIGIQKFGNIDAFIEIFSKYDGRKVIAKDMQVDNHASNEKHPLFNRVCVFMGTIEGMTREQAKQAVVNVGRKREDGGNEKNNYSIVGSFEYAPSIKGDKNSKIRKAEKCL